MVSKIRVLVVDDSALAREVITNILETDPQIEVIATAKDGKKAIDLARIIRPDIITMDIAMPGIDGLEATRQIMAYSPTPIVIVTDYDFERDSSLVFKALDAGALDVMDKPSLKRWSDLPAEGQKIIQNLKVLSKVKVITHLAAKRGKSNRTSSLLKKSAHRKTLKVIAIAASTGGPNALLSVLGKLPKNFPAPIVIVQHITKGFISGLVSWLGDECKITIREAKNGSLLESGVAYICPSDYHLKLSSNNKIMLDSHTPPVKGFRPSANVLFESAGKALGNQVTGVILTGMGNDGTEGLKVLKALGGRIIAQDEETSVIFGMPQSAIKADVVDKVCSLDKIADELLKEIK